MMKSIQKVLLFGAAVLLLLYFYSCSCSSCNKNLENDIIPDSIFASGDELIISISGVDFFNRYISKDLIKSQKKNSGYHLFYKLKMIDKHFVDEEIHFYVDTNGVVLDQYKIIGIPSCEDYPLHCEFNVDEEESRDIAEMEGVQKGIREWDISFRWSEVDNRYVWHILSTLEELKIGERYKGNGEEIIIDPYNGAVIEKREWEIK